MPAHLVLLHGAYHGPEIWDVLRGHLEKAGVSTLAPPVDHADPGAVVSFLAKGQGSYSLLAHSLAGLVAGELIFAPALAGRIQDVAYLAAYVPRKGESAADLARLDRGAAIRDRLLIDRTRGELRLDPETARDVLFGTAEPSENLETAIAGLRPQSLDGFRLRTENDVGAKSNRPPKAYIVCKKDRAITPALQRRMAADAKCDPVVELTVAHMPMVTDSEELACLLLKLRPGLVGDR
jgi:hypothetical protein